MLSSRREVVPLDGHQRDEAADPVCRSRGVDAGQDKEACVRASAGSSRGTSRAERQYRGGGSVVDNTMHRAQSGDSSSVSERLQLDGFCVTNDFGCFGLDTIKQCERGG